MAKFIENGIEMSLKRMLTAYKVIHELPKKYYRYYLLSFFFACTKDAFMYICA